MTDDGLKHDHYGHYNETPHADIELNFQEWDEAVKRVLEYQIGPPVGWEYDGGILFMWGDNLDEELLRDIADACNDLESELSREGHYEAARSAQQAASWVMRAEVHPPGEAMIT